MLNGCGGDFFLVYFRTYVPIMFTTSVLGKDSDSGSAIRIDSWVHPPMKDLSRRTGRHPKHADERGITRTDALTPTLYRRRS